MQRSESAKDRADSATALCKQEQYKNADNAGTPKK
jgi:hypothetical protein